MDPDLREYVKQQEDAERNLPPISWPVDNCLVLIAPRNGDRPLMLSYHKCGTVWKFVDYSNF